MTERIEFSADRPPPDVPGLRGDAWQVDVPTRSDILPDGRAVLVVGEPARWGELPLLPSDSARSCGEGLLRTLGVAPPPGEATALSVQGLADWLETAGVAAALEQGHSLEDLAQAVEAGWGVVAFVNSGELWNRADTLTNGDPDRAVLVSALARHPQQGELMGIYVSEPAREAANRFVPAETLEAAWLNAGGVFIVAGVRNN